MTFGDPRRPPPPRPDREAAGLQRITRPLMTTPCIRCGGLDRPPQARGLCTRCYSRAQAEDRLADYPAKRTSVSRDILLDDWAFLRDNGATVRDAAPRLGVSFGALDIALARAKRRGDPRGNRQPFGRD